MELEMRVDSVCAHIDHSVVPFSPQEFSQNERLIYKNLRRFEPSWPNYKKRSPNTDSMTPFTLRRSSRPVLLLGKLPTVGLVRPIPSTPQNHINRSAYGGHYSHPF